MFFQKIDDWLITHVFEPIAWHTEYHLGLSGMKLYLYTYMISFTSLGLGSYYKGYYIFTFVDMLLIIGQIYAVPHDEVRLRKNGGLNHNRMWWHMRIGGCAFAVCSVLVDIFSNPKYTQNDVLIDFGIGLLIISLYFGACNALPPGYEERKYVPQPI